MTDQSEQGREFPAVEDAAEHELVTVHIGEGLVVRPGDTLIIRLNPAGLTPAKVMEIQARLHTMFPDVRGVVFAADGEMAVQRAPELDDPARPLVPLPESVPFDFGPVGKEIDDFLEDPSIGEVRERPARARVDRGTDGPGGTT